jgi:hypothetical protein
MPSRLATGFGLRVLAALCAIVVMASAVNAAELVMFRRDGCPWCAAWDREIGPIYPKTDVGQRAPLRMVDLDRGGTAGFEPRNPIRYTPTFVLVENGREVGRIEGYPGDAFFWGLLDRLIEQLPPQSPKGVSAPAPAVRGAGLPEHIL